LVGISSFLRMGSEPTDDFLNDTDEQPLNFGARDCLLSSGQGLEIAFQKHCQSKMPGEVNLLWYEDDSWNPIGSQSPFGDSGAFGTEIRQVDYQVGLDYEDMDNCCLDLLEHLVDQVPLTAAIPEPSPPRPEEKTTKRESRPSGYFEPILESTDYEEGKPIKIYDLSRALKFRQHSVEKPKKKEMKKLKKLLEPDWKTYTFSGTVNPTSKVLLAAKLETIRLKESVANLDEEKIRLSEINVRLKAAFKRHLLGCTNARYKAGDLMKNRSGYANGNSAKSKRREVEKVVIHTQQVEGVIQQTSKRHTLPTPIPRSMTAAPLCTTIPDADTRFRVMIQAAGNNYVTNPGLMHRLKGRF